MPVEAPGPIDTLNPSWPQDSDEAREGAAHLRLIKQSLQLQFPNLNAPVTATPDEMGALAGATAASPLQAQIDAINASIAGADFYAIGDIRVTAYASVPTKWLVCDGSAVSRTTYADLFAVIGTTYGAPDGSTFNLPDLRGRSPLGSGQGDTAEGGGLGTNYALGVKNGAEGHTLTQAQTPLKSHAHTGYVIDAGSGAAISGTAAFHAGFGPSGPAIQGGLTTTEGDASAAAHSNQSPALVVQFLIKHTA